MAKVDVSVEAAADEDARVEAVVRQRIRALRLAKGLSQQQLGDLMGEQGRPMHQTTVAKLEAGGRPLWLRDLQVLARVLGTSIDQLVAVGDGDMERAIRRVAQARDGLEREQSMHRHNVESVKHSTVMVAEAAKELELAEAELRRVSDGKSGEAP